MVTIFMELLRYVLYKVWLGTGDGVHQQYIWRKVCRGLDSYDKHPER